MERYYTAVYELYFGQILHNNDCINQSLISDCGKIIMSDSMWYDHLNVFHKTRYMIIICRRNTLHPCHKMISFNYVICDVVQSKIKLGSSSLHNSEYYNSRLKCH